MDDTAVSLMIVFSSTFSFVCGYYRGRFIDGKCVAASEKLHLERLAAIDASYDKQVALINQRADELRAEIEEAQRKLTQGE